MLYAPQTVKWNDTFDLFTFSRSVGDNTQWLRYEYKIPSMKNNNKIKIQTKIDFYRGLTKELTIYDKTPQKLPKNVIVSE